MGKITRIESCNTLDSIVQELKLTYDVWSETLLYKPTGLYSNFLRFLNLKN